MLTVTVLIEEVEVVVDSDSGLDLPKIGLAVLMGEVTVEVDEC